MKGTVKVSFDYDETLSRVEVQAFAKELLDAGYEVWVVTMRFESRAEMVRYHNDEGMLWEGNDDLFQTAKTLGIPSERIVFTNLSWKSEFLKGKGFLWHLDDCPYTLKNIRETCPGLRAINSFKNPVWKIQCLRAITRKGARSNHE